MSNTTLVAETVGDAVVGATEVLYVNDVVKPAVFWNNTCVTVNDPVSYTHLTLPTTPYV